MRKLRGSETVTFKDFNLDILPYDEDWSFADIPNQGYYYATHGYHHYHAKFIPQLAKKIICKYSQKGDIILDPFGGCGTTLVEAKLNERNSIGIDISHIAVLISKAKTRFIDERRLQKKNIELIKKIKSSKDKRNYYKNAHPRLQYWFFPGQFNKLKIIDKFIKQERDSVIRIFYQCCLSHILKQCSRWYSKSVKPMRDYKKKRICPFKAFEKHLTYMTKKNSEFKTYIESIKNKNTFCYVKRGDARKLNLPNNSVDLIVTSPPYVTSYEYVDLHQLSLLWFNFIKDLKIAKEAYIGTLSPKSKGHECNSKIAKEIIWQLREKDKFLANRINKYYYDLELAYREFIRVLKTKKYLCLIIGNTEYRKTQILNAEVSIELLENIGVKISKIVKRKLGSKKLTPYRDNMGRFTNNAGKRKIYQNEYVIVAQKDKSY
ncbi:MAG TPA: hypothetical protein ENI51_00035 [Candidatus Atribacteria bacterium]|nr:hypothetical protein [Candidatus Atribacteria bacterium]